MKSKPSKKSPPPFTKKATGFQPKAGGLLLKRPRAFLQGNNRIIKQQSIMANNTTVDPAQNGHTTAYGCTPTLGSERSIIPPAHTNGNQQHPTPAASTKTGATRIAGAVSFPYGQEHSCGQIEMVKSYKLMQIFPG